MIKMYQYAMRELQSLNEQNKLALWGACQRVQRQWTDGKRLVQGEQHW